jgi:hypothetical protein
MRAIGVPSAEALRKVFADLKPVVDFCSSVFRAPIKLFESSGVVNGAQAVFGTRRKMEAALTAKKFDPVLGEACEAALDKIVDCNERLEQLTPGILEVELGDHMFSPWQVVAENDLGNPGRLDARLLGRARAAAATRVESTTCGNGLRALPRARVAVAPDPSAGLRGFSGAPIRRPAAQEETLRPLQATAARPPPTRGMILPATGPQVMPDEDLRKLLDDDEIRRRRQEATEPRQPAAYRGETLELHDARGTSDREGRVRGVRGGMSALFCGRFPRG